MFTIPFSRHSRRPRSQAYRAALPLTGALLALAATFAAAQSVPVPFAGTLAGGGTVCATSLPVFAVSGTGAKYGDGCPATQAVLNTPVAVATDSFGNVFVADQTYQLIRVIYNGGTALATALATSNVQNPGLIPVKGNIYTIAGGITATPTEGTKYCNQAGTGVIGTGSQLDNCPASESEQGPRGLATDADGNLFIASVSPSSQVRVLYVGGTAAAKLITLQNPAVTSPIPGYVYNLGGANASSYTGDNASAIKATMNTPRGIFVDANENVYFADQLNLAIRRIDSTTGFISTVAGHNAGSVSSCSAVTSVGDGAAASSATLACPYGLTIDQYGNIFIAEAGNGGTVPGRVRVVYEGGTLPGIPSPTVGYIYTYAGATAGTTGALAATFQQVFGVTLDSEGYLYVTDYRTGSTGSNRIWRIDPTNGNIAAIAGNGGSALTAGNHCNGLTTGPTATTTRGDGCPATQAYLTIPAQALGFTTNGTFYVTDRGNNVIRSMTYNNNFPATATGSSATQALAFLYATGSLPITETFTVQGSSTSDYSDAGSDTCALNTTLATATTCVVNVKFAPTAAGQREGSLNIASATATIAAQTLNGIGTAPVLTISPGTASTLGTGLQPLSVSTDQAGNINISDGKGKQVLRTTIAGAPPTAYITGLGTPRQTTTDSFGNVFVADSTNNVIVEETFAGASVNLGTGLAAPQGVAADFYGNLFVADTGNNRLLYLSPLSGSQIAVALSGFTLNAPTALAIDATGDLFLLDTNGTRLLEIPLGQAAQQITLPSGAIPTALAFDPAGDLYLADKISGSILFVAMGGTAATRLVTGLTTPVGVAVSNTGNLFVADSSAASIASYNNAVNSTVFPTTNLQLTSLPTTLTLSNAGNTAATLSTPTFVETGSASTFPASGTPTCTAALALAPGATCNQAFVFSPTVSGSPTAKVVFSDTAGQSVTANFSGLTTNLILTNTTITLTNTGVVDYGQTAVFSVTMTPKSTGSAAPGGMITLLVDGSTYATQNVGTSPFTFNGTLSIGIHVVAANYSGDSIYAASNASTSITIGKALTAIQASYAQSAAGAVLSAVVTETSTGALAPTGNVMFYVDGLVKATVPVGTGTVSTTVLIADGTHSYYATYVGDTNYATSTSTTQTLIVARTATSITLTSTPGSPGGIAGLQLTATITPAGAGTPSGSIAFTNGSAALGSITLTGPLTVTLTTTTTSYPAYTFTATYSGDGLFDPSSVTITMGADFVVVMPTTAYGVPNGGQVVATATIMPINGYTGTLTAACTNLPANALCRFQPVLVSVLATANSSLAVEVFAGVNPNVGVLAPMPFSMRQRAFWALLLLAPVAFTMRRRKRSLPALLAMVFFVLLPSLSGCGASKTPAASNATFLSPDGQSTVTLTLTDANHVARSATFTLSVIN
jgi:sugar lactone lactonase YvrE